MNAYHKYMIFYTGLQLFGVAGLMKLVEYEKKQKHLNYIQSSSSSSSLS